MFKLEGSEEKRRFRFFRSKTKAKRNLFTSPSITQPFHEEMGPHLLTYRELLEPNPLATGFGATLMVQGPNGKICAVPFRLDLTVEDVIFTCCKKFGLDPADYFLKLIATLPDGNQEESMPNEEEFIVNLEFINIEICQKFIISVQFDADDGEMGFSLRPDLRNIGSVTHVIIDFIKPDTQAQRLGLSEGDEVVLINDIPVVHMSWPQVTEAITEPLFTLTVRMRHYQLPLNFTARTTHFHLQDLVCPSPPVVGKTMSQKKLGDLIVPKPTDDLKLEENSSSGSDDPVSESDDDKDRVHQLIQGSLEVTGLVDRWRAYEKEASGMLMLMDENNAVKMDPQTKMFKCVEEIVKSEKDHIKALELLVDRYLEPMRLENFLPRDKMNSISSNIMTLFVQQKQFLGRIEDLPDDDTINVKKMVDELCEAFTVHLDTFKQYSLFCATQHELDIIFSNVRDDVRLKEFLKARNPKQDHSLTLQSLLTKPVLRLLRYPLFLQALRDLTMKDSDEHRQLTEMISSVAVVTEYINEVKRVTELYADAFDLLLERSGLAEFGISVRVNHLLCHVTVMWLNPLSTGGGGGGGGRGGATPTSGRRSPPRAPRKGDQLTEAETKILRTNSKINGVVYVPWAKGDLAELRTVSSLPMDFTDPDGLIRLADKQKARLAAWQRPGEICENPKMFHLISSFSIKQTLIGDCSFVASLGVCADFEKKFKKRLITSCIYPQNRHGDPIINPNGKYFIRLYLNGCRRKVVIDDLLPVDAFCNLLCSHSNSRDEFWISLLEKAYMKVMALILSLSSLSPSSSPSLILPLFIFSSGNGRV
jgi:hypothetical protein